MTKRYVIGLTLIGFLACLVFSVMTMMIVSQKDYAYMIQTAAKQRTLSMRLAWLYQMSLNAKKDEERIHFSQAMEQTLAVMKKSHDLLSGVDKKNPIKITPLIESVFYDHPYLLDKKVKDFFDVIGQAVKSAGSIVQLRNISEKQDLETMDRLLDGFELVLSHVQKNAQDSASNYLFLASFIILLLIVVIVLEALFVFRPMINFATKKSMDLKIAQKLVDGIRNNSSNKNMRQTMLISQLSQELQHPINSTLTAVDVMKDEQLTDKQIEYLNHIEIAANSLSMLVSDIMDYAYMELGNLELNSEPIQVKEFIEAIVEQQQKAALENEINLKLEFDTSIPTVVLGDMGRLEQVFSSMISAAVDMLTETDELLVYVWAKPEKDESVSFRVTVIEPEFSDKVQTLEARKDWRPETDVPGLGLRLRVCQQLCNLMGGELFIRTIGMNNRVYHCTIKLLKSQESENKNENKE